MLKEELQNIKKDLSQHHRPKDCLLEFYINTRLNKTIMSYYEDVTNSFNYLEDRNELNVMKKMNSRRK